MTKQNHTFEDGITDEYLQELEEKYGKPDTDIGGLFGAPLPIDEAKKKNGNQFHLYKAVLAVFIAFIILGGVIVGWMYLHEGYDKLDNWALYHSGSGQYADIFLVEATTNAQQENYTYKQAREDERYTKLLNENKQKYMQYGRVYAPFYRQAPKDSVTKGEGLINDQLKKAYGDIKEAFAYYLKHDNNGRPIILIGREQGSAMLVQLLKDYFNEPNQKRLIAAYILDYPIEQKDFKGYIHLELSSGTSDVGKVVQTEEDLATRIQAYYRDSISSQGDFVEALGGLESASAKDNIITLNKDITLDKTLVIAQGSYTLLGNGHKLIRNINEDLISILPGNQATAKLTLGKKDGSDELILDGNAKDFPKAKGAIVGLYGSAQLQVYDGVVLEQNSREGYPGGAIYGECTYEKQEGDQYVCYEPTINIFGGTFANNKTNQEGGAIALIGAYSELEKTSFGILNIYGGVFKDNQASEGNQIFADKGTVSYVEKLGFAENDLKLS